MKLNEVVGNIHKKFGKESIAGTKVDAEFLNSGSLGLNIALGGGWAKGRVAEISGWESSGKTTVALHAIAEAQKEGKIAAIIDMENAMDLDYAAALGVDIDLNNKLILSQPDDGETGIGIMLELMKCDDVGIIVFDSVGALQPKTINQAEVGDAKMGVAARLMSQELPKVTAAAKRSNCVVIFINQKREKIGIVFGNPETTMGGNALKYAASQRVDIRRTGSIKEEGEEIANATTAKVIKNKVAPPFRKAEFDIRYGEGIDRVGEILKLGVDYSVVNKSGSWYSYGTTKLGQGAEAVRNLLVDNPELCDEIEGKILKILAD